MPARRKFLKTKETEWRAVINLFHALALTYQHVSFKLYHEGRNIYTVPATSSLSDRLAQLFEPSLVKNLLLISSDQVRMNISVTGAITDRSYVRFDRGQIFVFVNNRWVKNHKLAQALIKGYQGMLQPQRYPAGFLFITLDPAFVDINIHPRKEEVQFLHPRIIEELVEKTVQERLEEKHSQQLGGASQVMQAGTLTELQEEPVGLTIIQEPARLLKEPFAQSFETLQHDPLVKGLRQEQTFLTILDTHFSVAEKQREMKESRQGMMEACAIPHQLPIDEPLVIEQQPLVREKIQLNYRLIGQLQTTYIMIETQEGLVLIDQHAAHERIIYERLRDRFDDVARVRLLFPTIITLTRDDVSLIEPYLELLLHFGVDAQRLSDHELVIQETPVFLKNQSLEDSIKQAISVLHEYQYLDKAELKKIMHERVHASLSCKAAVKAGDELSTESMHEIIKGLYATDNKLTCPHGRPTIWELRTDDIQKKFKRDYRT